jgi:hypothetical protein
MEGNQFSERGGGAAGVDIAIALTGHSIAQKPQPMQASRQIVQDMHNALSMTGFGHWERFLCSQVMPLASRTAASGPETKGGCH